jgi:hypothetical protein
MHLSVVGICEEFSSLAKRDHVQSSGKTVRVQINSSISPLSVFQPWARFRRKSGTQSSPIPINARTVEPMKRTTLATMSALSPSR